MFGDINEMESKDELTQSPCLLVMMDFRIRAPALYSYDLALSSKYFFLALSEFNELWLIDVTWYAGSSLFSLPSVVSLSSQSVMMLPSSIKAFLPSGLIPMYPMVSETTPVSAVLGLDQTWPETENNEILNQISRKHECELKKEREGITFVREIRTKSNILTVSFWFSASVSHNL